MSNPPDLASMSNGDDTLSHHVLRLVFCNELGSICLDNNSLMCVAQSRV
jgi:hypothetical protein